MLTGLDSVKRVNNSVKEKLSYAIPKKLIWISLRVGHSNSIESINEEE